MSECRGRFSKFHNTEWILLDVYCKSIGTGYVFYMITELLNIVYTEPHHETDPRPLYFETGT